MRKSIVALVLVFSLVSSLPLLFAAEIAAPGTPKRKLQRGFINFALSPMEISKELDKEKKRDTWIPSWVFGIGRGSVYAVVRALTGVYDMLTFFAPVPVGYEPLVKPEFSWEHLPEENQK